MGIASPVGIAIGGVAAEFMGVAPFFVVDGIVCAIIGVAMYVPRSVRALDAPAAAGEVAAGAVGASGVGASNMAVADDAAAADTAVDSDDAAVADIGGAATADVGDVAAAADGSR